MNNSNHNYNLTKCFSVKSKDNQDVQCFNKRKVNGLFCGIHSKMHTPIVFQPIINDGIYQSYLDNLNNNMPIKVISTNEYNINIEMEESEDENDKLLDFQGLLQLTNNLIDQNSIKITILRKSIKRSQLKNLINIKQSKQNIIKDLCEYFDKYRLYSQYTPEIITIQKNIRRWSILRRKICLNEVDILTMESKYYIPNEYFYLLTDSKNNKYAFDIRTLVKILEESNPKCPYTMKPFETSDIYQINKFINSIKYGINLEIEKPQVSPQKNIELRMIDIFHKINLLDNYTNHEWFKSLTIEQLQDFYIKAEDIWNYRAQLTQAAKCKIVKNGYLFQIPIHYIKNSTDLLKLQTTILNEIERAISEGTNIEERKLGAILMLTALVDVSVDAANALPHLVQVN